MVFLMALGLTGPVQAALPRSYFTLLPIINDSDFPALNVTFTLDFQENVTNPLTVAKTVDLTAAASDALVVNGTAGGTFRAILHDVHGDAVVRMPARVTDEVYSSMSENQGTPVFASLHIRVVYTDSDGARPRTIDTTVSFQLNYVPPKAALDLAFAGLAGLGGAGAIGLALFVGRRARLEELFLMHDSGMLIRHWTREDRPVHDDDIMSGMLIVLQEFVRDSFDDREGSLEQLRFGRKQVLMVRGQHTVLAAVARGRYLNGLPRKLKEAVEDFERSYAAVLANWNGNLGLFPRADEVAHRILRGRKAVSA